MDETQRNSKPGSPPSADLLARRGLIVGGLTGLVVLGCEGREHESNAAKNEPLATAPEPELAPDGQPRQTLAVFMAETPTRLAPDRPLELLPIGEYPRGFVVEYERVHLVRSPPLELLRTYAEAWFGLPVRVLPSVSEVWLEDQAQREFEGRRQYDAEALLDPLVRRRSPDAHALLALTLEDLFAPSIDGTFVFGLADIERRIAVHSMLRYDPGLHDAGERPANFEDLIRSRGLRVLVHELGHLLGLRHCFEGPCTMNPTEGLEDLDRLPLRTCDLCTSKLVHATGVDAALRERALTGFG